MVADNPHVRTPGTIVRSRASPSSVCTPRFVPINSCHSSTTMHRSPLSRSTLSGYDKISDRLSGVVTSADGNRSR
jgi:hypothetical protein